MNEFQFKPKFFFAEVKRLALPINHRPNSREQRGGGGGGREGYIVLNWFTIKTISNYQTNFIL